MSNDSVIISLLQNSRTAQVQFKGNSKKYTYKVPEGVELAEGDQVVVQSPIDGLVVVTVVSVSDEAGIDLDATFKYKWIVSKVDTAGYDALLAKEAAMEQDLKKLRRKAAIKKQIAALMSEAEDIDDLPESLSALKSWLK